MIINEVTLWLPDYWPPSLNVVRNQHWSKSRKHKQVAKDRLYIAAIQTVGKVPIFVGRARVEVCRLYTGRHQEMDEDNLMGSLKPLIDAMRAPKLNGTRASQGGIGIIYDDDPALLDLPKPTQHKAPWLTEAKQVTVITIKGDRRI